MKIRMQHPILLVLAALALPCSPAAGQIRLPKPILDLLPRNAVDPAGAWNNMGLLGQANVSALLTSSAPCMVERAPGRIGIRFRAYFGDKALDPAIETQLQEQEFASNVRRMADNLGLLRKRTSVIRAAPVKTEEVHGGRIAYYDLVADCSEGAIRRRPEARLQGLINTGKVFGSIHIEGPMTAAQIKALALATIDRIAKANLTEVGK